VEKSDGHEVATAVLLVLLSAILLGLGLWLAVARGMRLRADREADALSGWHDGLDALDRIDQRHHSR
jgi:hypothetical protein